METIYPEDVGKLGYLIGRGRPLHKWSVDPGTLRNVRYTPKEIRADVECARSGTFHMTFYDAGERPIFEQEVDGPLEATIVLTYRP